MPNLYKVTAVTTIRETYEVWAGSETEAEDKFENGDVPMPVMNDTIDSEFEKVELVAKGDPNA